MTYTQTHEDWLYLTVVTNLTDLYSRLVLGYLMNSTMATEVVFDAMMMAV